MQTISVHSALYDSVATKTFDIGFSLINIAARLINNGNYQR